MNPTGILRLRENVPLAPLTTFRIGGPARYFLNALTEKMVRDAVRFAKDKDLPVLVLGGGSNLLVSDRGFSGVVIKVGIPGLEWAPSGGRTIAVAGAGVVWDRFVAAAIERDLAGVECLSGIPGSVGGTPVQNVGAYGQEVSDVLLHVRLYDRENDEILELAREQCGFGYRTSVFNTIERDRYIVLRVGFSLADHGAPSIRYADLQREFEGRASDTTLVQVRAAVRRIRARKAMLLVKGDPDCRSAGSFFKNPILTEHQFRELQMRAHADIPRYSAGPGKVKAPAAWLIEHAGFSKGYSQGPAALSTRHTLALVARNGATADDILRLARQIRRRVQDVFGVQLMPEPVFVGFPREIHSEFFDA